MKKLIVVTALITFLFVSLVIWGNDSTVKEKTVKKYRVDMQTEYLFGKIYDTENEDLFRKICKEEHLNVITTAHSLLIMEATARQIHRFVKFIKEAGGKDIITKFRVSEPGSYSRKVLAEGGLISTPELKNQNIRSILKLLEGQTKYSFEYGDDVGGKIDLGPLEAPPLEEALNTILKKNGYGYEIEGNTIHVYRE